MSKNTTKKPETQPKLQPKGKPESRKNSVLPAKNTTNSRQNSQNPIIKSQLDLSKNNEKPREKTPLSLENPNEILPSLLTNPPKSNENTQKLLEFFKAAPIQIQAQTSLNFEGLKKQMEAKNKPSKRLFGFFEAVPQNIQAKAGTDFIALKGKFQQSQFEEDQKKFVEDLKAEQEREKKGLKSAPKTGKASKKINKKPNAADLKDQNKLIQQLEKAEEKERNLALVRGGQYKKKAAQPQSQNIENELSPEIQRQLDEAEKAKEDERNETRKKLIEAEKKKMLIEQKIREVEKEIKSIETSVSQRILEESESQNAQIIKILEEQSKKEAVIQSAELSKKMARLKAEKEARKQKEHAAMEKELQKRLEEEKYRRDETEEKLKEERRQKILTKLERINKRKEERKVMQDTANSLIKQTKTHYQQTLTSIEKNYERNIDIPELERKKKDLESRRNLYKPIDGGEIKEHEKKYEELRKIKEQEGRLRVVKQEEDKRLHTKKYASRLIGSVLEKDEMVRRKKELSMESRKQLIEKQQKYQSIIKDLFKPKVDPEKKKELEARLQAEQEKSKETSRERSIARVPRYEIEPIGETLENSGDLKGLTGGMKPQSEFSAPKTRKKIKINYQLPWKTSKNSLIANKTVEELNKEFLVTEMEANKNSKKYENYLKVCS